MRLGLGFYSIVIFIVSLVLGCSDKQSGKDEQIKPDSQDAPKEQLIPQRFFLVKNVTGSAFYAKKAQEADAASTPLKTGAKLLQGDLIQTEAESEIELQMDDGSVFTLQENSRLHLIALRGSPDASTPQQSHIRLQVGELLFQVKKMAAGSRLDMDTYTAVASIRGTSGGIGTSGHNTYAYLQTGELLLSHKGESKQSTTIKANQVAVQNEKSFLIKKATPKDDLKSTVHQAREKVFGDKAKKVIQQMLIPKNLQKEIENRTILHKRNLNKIKDLKSQVLNNSNELQKVQASKSKVEEEAKQVQKRIESVSNKKEAINTAKKTVQKKLKDDKTAKKVKSTQKKVSNTKQQLEKASKKIDANSLRDKFSK
jgi:hypothetical protein